MIRLYYVGTDKSICKCFIKLKLNFKIFSKVILKSPLANPSFRTIYYKIIVLNERILSPVKCMYAV